MSNLEKLLKLLLRFMNKGQYLPSKEAMRITRLGILMSPQLQLSLIMVLRFWIVQWTITQSAQAKSMSLKNTWLMILTMMMMTYLRYFNMLWLIWLSQIHLDLSYMASKLEVQVLCFNMPVFQVVEWTNYNIKGRTNVFNCLEEEFY